MKRRAAFLFLFSLLFFSSCAISLFKQKVFSYPQGVVFPVEKSEEVVYQGRIVDFIQKSNGFVYFSSRKGLVYCIDGVMRKIVWRYETSSPVNRPPHLGAGRVYACDEENHIYCLDGKGKLLWRIEVNENITSEVKENQGKIYFGTSGGEFIALDSLDGKEVWRFKAGGTVEAGPVFWNSRILFKSNDGKFYFFNQRGELLDTFDVRDSIDASPLLDGNFLYFGSHDHFFYCLDLTKKKIKWRLKTGGKVTSPPVSDEKRVYFTCADNVLYSLHKKNGSLLWWQALPSKARFKLEIIDGKIAATSLSPLVVCFDTRKGEKQGEFDAGKEIRSNPLWLDPFLLVTTYDSQEESGRLLFLKKTVSAALTPSRESPIQFGEDVTFTVSVTGFFHPQYEFYLKTGERVEIVQKLSPKNSWNWFPEKDGAYSVGVRAVDEKEEAVAEILFIVEKK